MIPLTRVFLLGHRVAHLVVEEAGYLVQRDVARVDVAIACLCPQVLHWECALVLRLRDKAFTREDKAEAQMCTSVDCFLFNVENNSLPHRESLNSCRIKRSPDEVILRQFHHRGRLIT